MHVYVVGVYPQPQPPVPPEVAFRSTERTCRSTVGPELMNPTSLNSKLLLQKFLSKLYSVLEHFTMYPARVYENLGIIDG
jgi:hypothetical protein